MADVKAPRDHGISRLAPQIFQAFTIPCLTCKGGCVHIFNNYYAHGQEASSVIYFPSQSCRVTPHLIVMFKIENM